MIKVNLLKEHTVVVPKKQHTIATPKISWIWLAYIIAVGAITAVLGYQWIDSGNALKKLNTENQSLQLDLNQLEALSKQFVELEQKKQERQDRIDIIERLVESQQGPVKLMNAVIQAIPDNRNIWLTSLEQTTSGVKVKGETRVPEVVPAFMKDLEKSGIFESVDIEIVERRDEISNFSILCANKK